MTEPTGADAGAAEVETDAPSDEGTGPDDVVPPDSSAEPTVGADAEAETPEVVSSADGASVFASSCANCHGANGTGTGRGPSILGIGQFFPQDASPLVNLVTNGGTNMPAFGTRLTPDEINSVVEYVVATFQ